MAKGKKHTVRVPVESYAPLADHYKERVTRLADQAVAAMAKGELEFASRLYEQGVFAQRCYDHYRRMASCVGDLSNPLSLPKPEEEN